MAKFLASLIIFTTILAGPVWADGPSATLASTQISQADLTPRERLDALAGAGELVAAACCKYCSAGKACGDSCISRSYTCHKGKGCACDR